MKFIPKKGEPCICTGFTPQQVVTPDYVGASMAVFTHKGREYAQDIEFFTEKSNAEIEREETLEDMKHIVRASPTQAATCEMLYDAGFRKQQVKPLSYDGFRSISEERLKELCESYAKYSHLAAVMRVVPNYQNWLIEQGLSNPLAPPKVGDE